MNINNIRVSDIPESINTSNSSIELQSDNIQINNRINNIDIYKALSSTSDAEKVLTDEMFDKAVEEINKHISFINRRFEYEIHEGTNKVMVRVFDSSTDKVIREIPPESRLDAIAKMWEMSGIVVDNAI